MEDMVREHVEVVTEPERMAHLAKQSGREYGEGEWLLIEVTLTEGDPHELGRARWRFSQMRSRACWSFLRIRSRELRTRSYQSATSSDRTGDTYFKSLNNVMGKYGVPTGKQVWRDEKPMAESIPKNGVGGDTRVAPATAANSERKVGDEWMHPVTGTIYVWDGEFYQSTGKKPFGADPLGVAGGNYGP